MKYQITKYINEIIVYNKWNFDSNGDYVEKTQLQYLGDGEGDFEELSENTTEDCLKAYITYCKKQISLAKNELKRRKQ